MSLSLPTDPSAARSLTDVVPELLASLSGESRWFAPAQSAIVVLVDGLGRGNLTARSGHARFLTSRLTKRDAARTVFPSTTAAALTSLLTATMPGTHGIVGYRVRIPGTNLAPNQLQGWESDGLDPYTWQRAVPLFERENAHGRPCFVVSKAAYAATGFTVAIQRGATFVAAETVADRFSIAADVAARNPGALVYVYAPELDSIGHAHGWESDAWLAALETVDGAARQLEAMLPPNVGAVITADHGMVDIPQHRQVLVGAGDPLWDGVALVGGEPRMLHLYTEPGSDESVLARWRAREGERAWVMSRSDASDAGLFGAIDPDVLPRIGNVLVAARGQVAYYDDREVDKKAQRMIGQHGSLTDLERIVPLVRLGAFA